ncbi:probable isoaspartyl peptidase/L-asparaginase GA20639 [Eupeodes corollae]|uniref:probable isoaspartyl peptidase/L-asparaginase GA20639 n=1 Tax=Eupeodes corollae TaxID=290404 RepID=UPI00249260B5|nr:probable isoaspartyl peptidase/L-asparaginase GA20639 [Eupeodes corollae]XP_055912158.1 probable isoaspartyl peptidase/L-asparaginase GA20639 [Eupeodes corollae]
MQPILIVQGGAGDITDSRVPGKLTGIKNSIRIGIKILENGGSALDAVEQAVRSMELDENFNTGYGACLNTDGVAEVEASIMEGKNLKAGCVTLLHDIMHPISVARKVMEKTNHTFIGGEQAMNFARSQNFEVLPQGSLVTENAKLALEEFKESQAKGLDTIFSPTELDKKSVGELGETVGAVAIDVNGNIAVATSTGGITGKIPGRIGDTPILGCGTYADNEIGGVSTTGHGETIMRYNLAQRILQGIALKGVSSQKATEDTIKEMTQRLIGTAGAITIDKKGDVGIYFSSKRMAWAYTQGNQLIYGINPGEILKEDL